MNNWNYQSELIKPENLIIAGENDENYIKGKNFFFLIGSKGYGKTHLLRCKSFTSRQNNSGETFFPITSLSEQLNLYFDNSLKISQWEEYWYLILISYISIKSGKNIDDSFVKQSEYLSSFASSYLVDKLKASELTNKIKYFEKEFATIRQSINCYFDDITESIYNELYNAFKEYKITEDKFIEILNKYILGFTKAVIKLNRINSKINIFSTITKEHFDLLSNKQKSQIISFCFFIEYSDKDIISIFEKQIDSNLNGPEKFNYFFGFNTIDIMRNPFIVNKNGELNESFIETPFQYLRRHCRGTPREIMFLGSRFWEYIHFDKSYSQLNKEDKIVKFKKFISEHSEKILTQILREISLGLKEDELLNFLSLFKSPIVRSNEIIDKQLIALKLYNFGLLGIVLQVDKGSKQYFNQNENSIFQINSLPLSKFYLVHPILHRLMNLEQYTHNIIIGHNIDFMEDKYRFDIAFSFAGEDRSFVEDIVNELKPLGLKIFYDNHYKSELWGKDLYQYLSEIYSKTSKYCIVIVSENYASKLWTKHELRNAQERAFSDLREYILPIKLDTTELPGLNKTIGYLNYPSLTVQEIAKIIIEKLSDNQ